MRLIIDPHAKEELSAASRYYEEQNVGLGVRFFAECTAAIDQILEAPGRYRRVDGEMRRFRLDRFPYSVFYRLEKQAVLIVAFAHDRRQPGYWRSRLSD